MNIVWALWKAASIVNATKIYTSGKPERILKHIVRKRMFKFVGNKTKKGWF